MIEKLMKIFGCQHQNKSWPRTRNSVCYQVCLDCGSELRYDWKNMRSVELTSSEKRRIMADRIGASL